MLQTVKPADIADRQVAGHKTQPINPERLIGSLGPVNISDDLRETPGPFSSLSPGFVGLVLRGSSQTISGPVSG